MKSVDLGILTGPILLFGGPYSNLSATLALRSVAEERLIPPERVICTGDLVAYCAEPEETVNLIREWGIPVVMGNCEESLATRALDCGCGFDVGSVCSALSVQWFQFADSKISDENRLWMGSLPREITFQFENRRFSVVHGGVESINRFFFASTPVEEKSIELSLLDPNIDGLIAGHSGIPFGEIVDGKAWLNTGVVGLPANDGTVDGWYMVLEPRDGMLQAQWHRLSYPTGPTRQAMIECGLSRGYADTIINGLWPSEDVLPSVEKESRGKPLNCHPLIF